MRTTKSIIYLIGIVIFTSCGRSTADRIAHKWTVQEATYSEPNMNDIDDSLYWELAEVMESGFRGGTYDIKNDGTYSFTIDDHTVNGKWSETDHLINFTSSSDAKPVTWEFDSESGAQVFHDHSLEPIIPMGGGAELRLRLVPMAGENVETDF